MSRAIDVSSEDSGISRATCKPRHDLTEAEEMAVKEVLDEHIPVVGISLVGETWAIYGSIPVDGEVIVAEFDNRADAQTALEEIAAAEQEL
jgi:hypothetical protein